MISRGVFEVWVFGLTVLTARAGGQEPDKYQGHCASTDCHGGFEKRKRVHDPIRQGACDACHEAVAGERHKFRLVREGAALCTECHEEVTKDMTFLHGPVAAGVCTACHDPHASDLEHLQLREEKSLCLECHTTIEDRMTPKAHVHKPVSDGCLACHNAHGAKNKLFLTSEPPGLCLDCHDNIATLISEGSVKHAPMSAERSCMNCHDAHVAQTAGLLTQSSLELCMACHNQETTSPNGKIANMAEVFAGNPHLHGPVSSGECGACHNPHGGSRARLLTMDYPPKFYAPFEEKLYALCFECHEAAAFTEKETDSATGFRHGTRNLHYVHVNQSAKGRTCRACHEVHASKNAKHIAERVPFGGWQIPLGYKETQTGGSCQSGCHRPQTYDREFTKSPAPSASPAP